MGAALDIFLRIEPENPAAKALHAKASRSAIESNRRSRKAAQRMFADLGKDPRVQPTRRELFTEFLRSAPREVWRYMADFRESPGECRRSCTRKVLQFFSRRLADVLAKVQGFRAGRAQIRQGDAIQRNQN